MTILDFINSAIIELGNGAAFSLTAVSYEDFTTTSADPDKELVYDRAAVVAKAKELEADYKAKEYQRQRQPAYPSIGEQLDLIYHAGQGGDAFQAAIKAVKDKYPKPE